MHQFSSDIDHFCVLDSSFHNLIAQLTTSDTQSIDLYVQMSIHPLALMRAEPFVASHLFHTKDALSHFAFCHNAILLFLASL